jgi:murein DD-endopeptidase MepM/ murein hydrolase activator NlpD
MTRRVVVIALAAAAVFAAILGAASVAQAPEPTSSPDSTPTVIATAPAETATPQVTATVPAETPTETATEAPTETATQAPTADAPTPEASPEETATTAPAPDAAGTATPGHSPAPAAPAKGVTRKKSSKKTNTEQKVVKVEKCSTSTSARECDRQEPNRDDRHEEVSVPAPQLTTSTGAPAPTNPSYSVATVGPAPIGVPNFFIDKFRIPPFLLSIYQAAGMQYGVRWEVLAAINEIETDYGRNLNISSAGAVGWMQFMPATWKMYGVDANRDGAKDPFNPVDAIFAAARYLRAAGGDQDIRRAIFAYNHADWYVDSVLLRARVIGGLPSDLVGSLTGLTQGRFPVHAKATYAGKLERADRERRIRRGANAALVVESDGHRRGIDIFARKGAKVIAVNDGKVVRIGRSKRLGRFVKLLDVYGNTYTYAHLGEVAKTYPAPKKRRAKRSEIRRELKLDKAPKAAASATEKPAAKRKAPAKKPAKAPVKKRLSASGTAAPAKERLFAHPERPNARAAGGAEQLGLSPALAPSGTAPLGFDKKDFVTKKMHQGAKLIGGTVLGRIGKGSPRKASHMLFEIRPAGRGAPRVDPKPILDGWKLLESTAIYRAAKKNPFVGEDAKTPTIGQILLMSKETLIQRVVNNPRISVYGCGTADIRSGQIDRRVLATLEYLASSGLKPTVSSLRCGHGYLTASGNVSEHSTGTAVDIAAVNGVPIVGHQGSGSITDITIQRLLTLQGTMKPHQIISLMTYDNADNTFAMGDHDDHIHVGWRPLYGQSKTAARRIDSILKPQQWIKLIDRIGEIDNPEVREAPSRFSLKVTKRASQAHHGE